MKCGTYAKRIHVHKQDEVILNRHAQTDRQIDRQTDPDRHTDRPRQIIDRLTSKQVH